MFDREQGSLFFHTQKQNEALWYHQNKDASDETWTANWKHRHRKKEKKIQDAPYSLLHFHLV